MFHPASGYKFKSHFCHLATNGGPTCPDEHGNRINSALWATKHTAQKEACLRGRYLFSYREYLTCVLVIQFRRTLPTELAFRYGHWWTPQPQQPVLEKLSTQRNPVRSRRNPLQYLPWCLLAHLLCQKWESIKLTRLLAQFRLADHPVRGKVDSCRKVAQGTIIPPSLKTHILKLLDYLR